MPARVAPRSERLDRTRDLAALPERASPPIRV